MKKIISLFLAISLAFALGACGGKVQEEKVTLKYYSSAADMLPALKTEQLTVGLLPEPAATKLTKLNTDYSAKLDVQQLYGGNYPQAVLVVKKSVVESDASFVKSLIDAVTANAAWLTADEDNAQSAVTAINGSLADGVTASLDGSITQTVVENCNVYFENALAAKQSVASYLTAMKSVSSDAAADLSDSFYYSQPTGELSSDATGEYSVYMPDGAPALAMAQLIKDDMQFDRRVSYTVVSANNIGPSVLTKKADVAIMPITAASKTIGNGENYVFVGVVTHGNLFVMGVDGISELSDLKGKTVGIIGQGQVPDLTFRYLLNKANIGYAVAE